MKLRLALWSLAALASATAAAPAAQHASIRSGKMMPLDYPAAAAQLRQEGTVVAAYRVMRDGSVSNCRVAQTSGSEALDTRTCQILVERFLFNPALDASGTAIEEERIHKIEWKLPASMTNWADAKHKAELLVTVNTEGKVDTCEAIESSGDPAWDLKMCKFVALTQEFDPELSRNGKPRKSRRVVPVYE